MFDVLRFNEKNLSYIFEKYIDYVHTFISCLFNTSGFFLLVCGKTSIKGGADYPFVPRTTP